MFADKSVLNELRMKLSKFPLVQRFLAPSLEKRIRTDHWYENRVIVYILREAHWVERLEREFSEAQLNTITNSEEIFGVLTGTETGYDQQLFDAIAEVRLARWGRRQGYQDIEKLKRRDGATPDFCMKGQGKIVLAEAKHFRARDYLLDYVYDRLHGLAFKARALNEFGFIVEAGDQYDGKRDALLGANRLRLETICHEIVRSELSETFFRDLLVRLASSADEQVPVLGGLLTIRRRASPGGVDVSQAGSSEAERNVKLFLSKIYGELTKKVEQIQSFLNATSTAATHAVVFFAGTHPAEIEWSDLWETLNNDEPESQWARDCANSIYKAASALINVPFELIVSKGNGEYGPFPWKPGALQF